MSTIPEAVLSEPDRKRPEAAVKETTGHEGMLHPLDRAVSAMGASGADDPRSKLMSSGALRNQANTELRVQVMRRAQQDTGNHRSQQFVAQLRRSPLIQRECVCGGTCAACQAKGFEEEESAQLQRQASEVSLGGGMVDASVIPTDSSGQQLDQQTRAFMEPRLGSDFSGVRVHTDARAAESAHFLSADAYTTGRDIYFAAGKYAPASREGQHLIAHELTHTVQQRSLGVPDVLAKRPSKMAVSKPGDPLEEEAERGATRAMGSAEKKAAPRQDKKQSLPVTMTSAAPPMVQRDPSGDPAPAPTAESAFEDQLEEEIKAWDQNTEQDADLLLRAKASRMVLLLAWAPRGPFLTHDDYDKFTSRCDAAALTEMDTLNLFSEKAVEFALAVFPKGFPLTWSGRVQAALTLGSDPAALLKDYAKAFLDLSAKADALVPAILQHGLPVEMEQIDRLNHFTLAMGLSSKDSEVKDYARESLRYVQMKWLWVFAFTWEKTVNEIAQDVADGKTIIAYTDYMDFVQNKQAILRALPERARGLPSSMDDVQQMQDSTVSLKDAALLTGFVSGLASIFGGIFGGWDEASSLFDGALVRADAAIAGADKGERLGKALEWAWDNGYFGGAAGAQVRALIDNGPLMLAVIAGVIVAQFIPGLNIALDFYLAVTMGLDVLRLLVDLGTALDRVMNSASVRDLQRASVTLSEVLVNGGIQVLMVLLTEGIGKVVARIRKGAAEARAVDSTLSQAAAEKKAVESLSKEERAPLDKAAQKVETFDKSLESRYSEDTKPILDTPGVRGKLASISEEARKLLELCNTPCLPPAHQLLEADLKLLEKVQQRLGRPGYDYKLKEFFYNRRSAAGGLKQAIEDLNGVKKAEDLGKFLEKEAKAAKKVKVDEATKLLDETGKKFADQALEDRYQRYIERKKSVGEEPRSRAEWKVASDFRLTDSPFARGNKFDKTAGSAYDYNQVNLEDGTRLDSYVPGKEIISRKATDFDRINDSTFREYLEELRDKYHPGKKIRSNTFEDIDGKTLKGKQFLEVPASNEGTANAAKFEKMAKDKGITIRYTAEE
jgi:hypothetical protein